MTTTPKLLAGSTWREDPITVTTGDLVRWAGATGDFTEFHFDKDAAIARGFRGPVVNGPWKARACTQALLNRLDTRAAEVRRMSFEYRKPDVIGEPMTFEFTITAVTVSEAGDTALEVNVRVLDLNEEVSTVGVISVHVREAHTSDELPLERVRSAVALGTPHGPFTYRIEPADIHRYQRVTGRPENLIDDVMPAAFFGALDPVERRDLELDSFLLDLPIPKVGGGNAFNEVDYERPIHAGETITVTTTYTEVYEKTGRASRLLFRVRENTFIDESGAQVGKSRNGHVLAYQLAAGGAA
jgi:acyl dehydratase